METLDLNPSIQATKNATHEGEFAHTVFADVVNTAHGSGVIRELLVMSCK